MSTRFDERLVTRSGDGKFSTKHAPESPATLVTPDQVTPAAALDELLQQSSLTDEMVSMRAGENFISIQSDGTRGFIEVMSSRGVEVTEFGPGREHVDATHAAASVLADVSR